MTREGIQFLSQELKKLGAEVIPSEANFVCFCMGYDAVPIYNALLQRGIIVRHLASFGMDQCIRVTVGLKEDNVRFINALEKYRREILINKRGEPLTREMNSHDKLITITIDGPAAAGKSTVARLLAQRLGFVLLDSGALYRVMALHLTRCGVSPDDESIPEKAIDSLDLRIQPEIGSMKIFLGSQDVTEIIRQESIGEAASRFSTRPEIRKVLAGNSAPQRFAMEFGSRRARHGNCGFS